MVKLKKFTWNKKENLRKVLNTLKKVVLTVVILVAIFAIAGVLYVKFANYDVKDTSAISSTDTAPKTNLPKPKKVNLNQPVSAGLESLLTPIKAGENTSMTVGTLPGAECTIAVTYNNAKIKDSGLVTKKADDYGKVTWSWSISKSSPKGKYPIKVVCKLGKKSALLLKDLEVK